MYQLQVIALLGALGLGSLVAAHGNEDHSKGTGSTGVILPSAVNATSPWGNGTYGTVTKPTATSHYPTHLTSSAAALTSTECSTSRVKVTTTTTVTVTVDEATPSPGTETSAGNGDGDSTSSKDAESPASSGSGSGYDSKSDGGSSVQPITDATGSSGSIDSDDDDDDDDVDDDECPADEDGVDNKSEQSPSTNQPDNNFGDYGHHKDDKEPAESSSGPSSSSLAAPQPTSSECPPRHTVTVTTLKTVTETATLDPVASGTAPYSANNGTVPTGTGSASYKVPSLTSSSSAAAAETGGHNDHVHSYKVRRRYHL